MNITVIGATGRVGRLVAQYAREANHNVTVFARTAQEHFRAGPGLRVVQGSVLEPSPLAEAIAGADAVVSCLGAQPPYDLLWQGVAQILAAMEHAGVRRVVGIGGAGLLQAGPGRLRRDADTFPDFLRPVSEAHHKAWQLLEHSGTSWTFVCPPGMPNRTRTGQYLVAADAYPKGGGGEIAAEDVADFIIRELIENQFVGHRVGICYGPRS